METKEMDELRYRQLKTLKELNDHPLFAEMVAGLSRDFATEMLVSPNAEMREAIYNEFQGFNRILGKINAYVGELAMLKEKKENA